MARFDRLMRTESHRERGQAVVMFALLIPVIFALGAIVMDIGNWYVHKRHLQTQVDSAVLAAGLQFSGCPRDATPANVNIGERRTRLRGRHATTGAGEPDLAGVDNERPGPAARRRARRPQQQPVLDAGKRLCPGNERLRPRRDPIATPGDPCATRFIDAKATDEDAPSCGA